MHPFSTQFWPTVTQLPTNVRAAKPVGFIGVDKIEAVKLAQLMSQQLQLQQQLANVQKDAGVSKKKLAYDPLDDLLKNEEDDEEDHDANNESTDFSNGQRSGKSSKQLADELKGGKLIDMHD